jgi:archaellum component FlaC
MINHKFLIGVVLGAIFTLQTAADIITEIKTTIENSLQEVTNVVADIERLPNTIETELNRLKNDVEINVKNSFNSVVEGISTTANNVKTEIEGVPGRVTSSMNALENEINGITSDLKTSVLDTKRDIDNFFADTAQKVKSGVAKIWDDATDVDPELLKCLGQLAKPIKEGLDDLGEFGDFVKKGLTEMLSPFKCMLCASVLTEASLKSCGCSSTDRKLSDSLWYAAEKYGPDSHLHTNKDQGSTSSTRRKLVSSPVTNDVNTCPSAPSESHSPGYSDTSHKFYSDFLEIHQKSIFPNIRFEQQNAGQTCSDLRITTDPIVSPNTDNNNKWDGRTNQNVVAALQAIESTIGNVFDLLENQCQFIPDAVCIVGCITNPGEAICWTLANLGYRIMGFFEYLNTAIDLHDGVVDGAEIQSTLINTERLINWTCSIEQTVNLKFQELEDDLTNAAALKTKLVDEIKTRFNDHESTTASDDLTISISALNTNGQDNRNNIKASFHTLDALLQVDITQRSGYGSDICTIATCPPPKKNRR